MFSMKIVPFVVFGLIVGMVAKVGIGSMAGMGGGSHGNRCTCSWSNAIGVYVNFKICSK